ncbi:MAG: cysteine desulfurase family protein, partial [Deltaproteobacteria bacterium]|nr:cysteine desulfurase family protein [Deltaproteobacteria bacterium]
PPRSGGRAARRGRSAPRRMIYLDPNASAPLRREAAAAMAELAARAPGNPSSAHAAGRAARAALEQARRVLAAALGVRAGEVVFTSGGTESNNLALLGALSDPHGAHVVVSPIEHASVLGPVRELERRGARVSWLAVDAAGRIDPADVAAACEPATALVSVGWANNEIGTVQPIAAIAAQCRARGVLLHVDAAQALGKLRLDLSDVDLCSLSAHKLGGPVGVGALVVRRGVALRPLVWGGEQERGARPGTENAAGAVGFAAALQAAAGDDAAALGARRDRLWAAIADLPGVRRHSPVEPVLAGVLNVSLDGLRGEALVAGLDLEGVAVSVGSACAAGSGEPSHVLRAIGCDDATASGALRFSLGPTTTAADVDAAAAALRRVVGRMRGVAPRAAVGG